MAGKMLENDEKILGKLLGANPFSGQKAPSYVRAYKYKYVYSKVGLNSGTWWERERIGEYMPPMDVKMVKVIYKQFGWKMTEPNQAK